MDRNSSTQEISWLRGDGYDLPGASCGSGRYEFAISTPSPLGGNVINLRGKPFWKRVFPLNPFPKTFKSFGKMAWKKPFFKRVSSKISARMLNCSWGRRWLGLRGVE